MNKIPLTDLSSDTRYAFAVGKIRAIEQNLITNQQANRLLETKDANSLWSELGNNKDYEAQIAQFPDPNDFESVLQNELQRVYTLVFQITADRAPLEVLALRYDFQNCKMISKARFLGEDTDIVLNPLGVCPPKEWEQLLISETETEFSFPAQLMSTLNNVKQKLTDEQDLRRRDIIWDQALYQYLSQQTGKTDVLYIKTWLKMRIDFINLMTFVRCVRQKADKKLLKSALFDNGTIPTEKLLYAYDNDLENLNSMLSSTPYAELFQEGLTHYKRENSFSYMEKLFDDYEMEFLGQGRYVALGVEPLFTYLLAKEAEVKVLRILLVGKINRLDKAQISKRIRRLYA